MIFEPLELVEKLAALLPPPRFNLVRYHGVLAPSATFRPLIIPESESSASPAHPNCPAKQQDPAHQAASKHSGCRPRNYSWSELMKRIFAVDVLECTRCGGRMRILCAIHPPEAIRRILDCLGLPSRPPPVAPAWGMNDPGICWPERFRRLCRKFLYPSVLLDFTISLGCDFRPRAPKLTYKPLSEASKGAHCDPEAGKAATVGIRYGSLFHLSLPETPGPPGAPAAAPCRAIDPVR